MGTLLQLGARFRFRRESAFYESNVGVGWTRPRVRYLRKCRRTALPACRQSTASQSMESRRCGLGSRRDEALFQWGAGRHEQLHGEFLRAEQWGEESSGHIQVVWERGLVPGSNG